MIFSNSCGTGILAPPDVPHKSEIGCICFFVGWVTLDKTEKLKEL
jgi:hypothetical protein